MKKSFFGSSEDVVSMFLGLVIVGVMSWIIFNYFQKKRGSVEIPGIGVEEQLPLSAGTVTVVSGEKEKQEIVVSDKKIYVVEKGDSLWKISQKLYKSGYNWVDIAKVNKLASPGLLAVGQQLNLPETISEKKTELVEYKVNAGDSLWKIAVAQYGDGFQWVRIWQANKNLFIDPNKIEIGMNLFVPKVSVIATK